MTESRKRILLYALGALFIALNSILLAEDTYWQLLLPVAIVVLVMSFLSIHWVFLITTLAVPLSVEVGSRDLGWSVSLPAEPLIIALMLIFLVKAFAERAFDTSVMKHPVSLAIASYLLWTLITTATSEMPLVSFKYFLSKLWFIATFYFLAIHIFKTWKMAGSFIWMYAVTFAAIIIYTTYEHYLRGFSGKSSHWVMKPFYNDHTHYGAALGLFLPFMIGYAVKNPKPLFLKILIWIAAGIFAVGFALSYSRAAWLSIGLTVGMALIILLKVRWHLIALTAATALTLFFMFRTEIVMKLQKNKQDSSAEFMEHVRSISNITTDDSNLERILRWNCALRMFKERPLTGWGPGTFAFQYAPFQRSTELTAISTNFGDLGTAHSEYLGPLAEQGLPGLAMILAIVLLTYFTAVRTIYNRAYAPEIRHVGLLILLGLFSYWMHGLLNNFLDTDKVAAPYWGFTAILVAMDIYHGPSSVEPAGY